MPSKEEMIKGLDALENLIREQAQLRRDGLIFIFEHGMWKDFIKYHCEQHIKRGGENK